MQNKYESLLVNNTVGDCNVKSDNILYYKLLNTIKTMTLYAKDTTTVVMIYHG